MSFLDHFKDTFTQTLNGEAVCFTPNGCKGARLKKNLSVVSAIFADFDFKPNKDKDGNPEPTGSAKPDYKQFMLDLSDLPTPTFVVESGNGWHLYWLLDEPIEVNDENRADLIRQVEGVHYRLHQEYGSDSGAVDILRLLRQPGTWHRKQPEHPFQVTVVDDNEDTRYTLDELMEAIPPLYKEVLQYEDKGNNEDYDIKQVVIDVWKEKGDEVTFDTLGRMIWNGQRTATFIGRQGNNYIATTSDEFPYRGNPTTYVAGVLGISTKASYRWLVEKYGEIKQGDVELDWSGLMKKKDREGNEKILANDENILYILEHHNVAKWDDFKCKPYLYIDGEWHIRDDGKDGELYSWLVRKYPFLASVTTNKVAGLITAVQYRNRYDSAQDYINGLEWDGEGRLNHWLSHTFYVEDDEFNQTIGKNWWMGMVSRILSPGSKFDHGLIIQGGQSIGKSTAFLTIAGEGNHVEFTDLKVKELQQDIQGKMIAEFAEAAIFSKHDQESIKSIVSRQTDTFRIPYERNARDFPRRCVFAVTANNDNLLKDQTGERRWWPVILPDDMKVYPPKRRADISWLEDNRDQLFAEAAQRYRGGENYWDVDDTELRKRQETIRNTEQDEELFIGWYNLLGEQKQEKGVTIREAYVGAYKRDSRGDPLDIASVSIKKADEMRVSRILKRIGLTNKKIGGVMRWYPSEHFTPLWVAEVKK